MSEVLIAMRRKGKTIVLALCLATITGCAQSQNQELTGHAKWARSKQKVNKNVPEYIPPNILPQTHFAAARLLEKQGLVDEAIVQYRKVIALNHGFIAAYHRLGILLSAAGRHSEATTFLRKAVDLAPKHAALRNDLGAELMFREHWASAEHEFRKATELKPSFARAYVNRGIALTRLGRFDEAKHVFKTVLPAPDALYNLGLMYRGQKRFADAANTFREVLEMDSNFLAARMQLEQVTDLIQTSTTNSELVEPKDFGTQRVTEVNADQIKGQGLRMASRSSNSSLPFDVHVAQQRREQALKSKQDQASYKATPMIREHVTSDHATASVGFSPSKDSSMNRETQVNHDNHVTNHDDKISDIEKLTPMLKFFRPKAEAQKEQQRLAQVEIDSQWQQNDLAPQFSSSQELPISSPGWLAVLPYDSPCDMEEYAPGDDENFEAMVDAEIRIGIQAESSWPIESFLPVTMASRIVTKFWSDADIVPESTASPVNFSIGYNESFQEIEALVAAETPCRDSFDDDGTTLQKFAAVQRVHQDTPYDNASFSFDHKKTKIVASTATRQDRSDRKSISVQYGVNSYKQGYRKDKPSPATFNRPTENSRSIEEQTRSAFKKNQRMSRKNAADQQWYARKASEKFSSSARKNGTTPSLFHDWQDCVAEPAVASAAYFEQKEIVNFTVNTRMVLREHERTLDKLREERRCLDRTLVERRVADFSDEDVVFNGTAMFGAGWQMPLHRSNQRGLRVLSQDMAYIPTAPGFKSPVNMLSNATMTSPNRYTSNRRSTMSSVVTPRRHEAQLNHDQQTFMPTWVNENGYVQYIQDFDLQMSLPVAGYSEFSNGYDIDPWGQWSLDPTIMDAPLEVLINETNCWEDQRRSGGVFDHPDAVESFSSSAENRYFIDFSSSQFADVRKRDRVEVEEDKDANQDDQKNDRPTQRSNKRRPWFKP